MVSDLLREGALIMQKRLTTPFLVRNWTGRWPVLVILTALLIASLAFGQETSAGLQGTVKDPTGALVVKAQVEVASPALIGTKKAETDQGGYYRFANLPPGLYTLTVTAAGFRTFKQERIPLEVGHLPSIEVRLDMGAVSETVEVSSQAAVIDATQSKVQTNIAPVPWRTCRRRPGHSRA